MFRSVKSPGIPGTLYLHSMPGRYERLRDFASAAHAAHISAIVTLTPRDEMARKSPDYEGVVATGGASLPRIIEAPVADYSVPEGAGMDAYVAVVDHVVARLRAGENVLVHCGAGIGRTGTFATAVLLALGTALPDALAAVRDAGSNPENALQVQFLSRWLPRRSSG